MKLTTKEIKQIPKLSETLGPTAIATYFRNKVTPGGVSYWIRQYKKAGRDIKKHNPGRKPIAISK